jgi:signal peptidase II
MSADLVRAEAAADTGAAPPPADSPAIPGERLGVPEGAARVVADMRGERPSPLFFAVVAFVTLGLDMATKTWAATHLDTYPGMVEVWPHVITLVLAKNRGGAWGLLQTASENVRRPFFLLVSVVAIVFIVTLYPRLQRRQRALRWGLPFVFGGALGNVLDRVRYGHVIDFIDCHFRERHWPTFNVADIAICVGVGLMALDMFFSKRGPELVRAPRVPPAQSGEPVPDWDATHHPEAPREPSAPADPSAEHPSNV